MSTRPLNSISSPNSMPLISYTYQCIMYQYTNLRIPLYVRFYHTRDSEANFARFKISRFSIILDLHLLLSCKDSNLSSELFLFFENYLSLPKRFEIQKSRRSNRKEMEKKIRKTERYEFLFFKFVIFLLVQSHLNGGTAFDFPREWSAS